MRRTRRLLLLLLALFALLLWWLLATSSGLRFLVARALPDDGSVRIASVEGSLWSGVHAQGIDLVLPGMRVQVRELRAGLALAPLLRGAVRLRQVDARGVQVALREVADRADAPAAVQLPDLRIEQLQLHDVTVARADASWAITRIDARVAMRGRNLAFDALKLMAPLGAVEGALSLDLSRPLPVHAARLRFTAQYADQAWQGALEAQTRQGVTGLTLALSQPLHAAVALGELRSASDWQAFVQLPPQTLQDAPVAASVQIEARERELRVQGDARFAEFQLTAMDASARMDDDALVIAPSSLQITAPQGRVEFSGRIPFDAAASIALQLRSDALRFAAADASPLDVRGSVALSGTRVAPVLTPALELERAGWPRATLSGRMRRQDASWLAEDLQLVSARSSLHLDGSLASGAAPAAALKLRLAQFDPALLVPEWPGAIDAELNWLGRIGEHGLDGELSVDTLAGTLRGRDVHGRGVVRLRAQQLVHADLELVAAAATLRLRREAADAPLQFVFDAPDLADLLPDWHGRVRATASIGETSSGEGEVAALRGPGVALAGMQWRASAGRAAAAAVSIQATLRGIDAGGRRVERAQLTVAGTRAEHRIDLDLQAGARQMQLAAVGALSPQHAWRGHLQGLDLLAPEWRASLVEPANLRWHDGRLTLARSCLRGEGGGRLCLLLDRDGTRTEAAAEVVAFDLGPLARLLAPSAPFTTAARLSGSIDLVLDGGDVQSLDARLHSAEGAFAVAERPDLDLGYRDLTLDFGIAAGVGQWQATATLRPEGRIDSSGSLQQVEGAWQYEGRLGLNVHRFDAIEAFTSQFASPRGDLSGEMQFRGRGAERPQWSGAFAVTGFAAELPDLGLQLSQGALAIAAVPGGVIVRGAITSGGGQLILDGGRDAGRGEPWHFALNGENAVLSDTPALRLVLSPALTLQQDGREWRLGGRVQIPSARIDAEVLAPAAATSSDVVIVDAVADDDAFAAERWRADVVLAFGDAARLSGYGFDGRVRGELRLRQRSGDNAYGQGQLQVSGRYAAYGQRLSIRRGRILFANSPLDEPTLDIEAERKAGSAVAGVRVTGTARNPQTEIYARPALPESEALALLVTGRALRNVSGGDRQRLSSAALALGTIGGDLLAGNLGAEIGLTGDAARGTEAFTIGKYLTPKIFVGYGIGLARRGSVLIVRYLIRDDIEVEVTTGEQSRASLNYVIER